MYSVNTVFFRSVTALLESPEGEMTSREAYKLPEDSQEAVREEIHNQRQEIGTALGFRSLSVLR